MLPFRVEIFDRSLNYKANSLIGGDIFEWKEDAIDPEKNEIQVPDGVTTAKGDILRVLGDGFELQGVVSAFERGEGFNTITVSQLVTLFDMESTVAPDSAEDINIESYIVNLLRAIFVNSGDSYQNIPNLSLTSGSSTVGTIFTSTSSEALIVINVLDDIIYPAFEKFAILSDAKATFYPKAMSATIKRDTESTDINIPKIEADLSTVFDKTFVIKKTDREINKAVLKDTSTTASYTYYLHPDGSFDTTNTNRIVPVINAYDVYNSTKIRNEVYNKVKAEYDAELAARLTTFNAYATSHNLTYAQLSELRSIGNWLFDWWSPSGDSYWDAIINLCKSCTKRASFGQPAYGSVWVDRDADSRLVYNPNVGHNEPGPGEYTIGETIWDETEYTDWTTYGSNFVFFDAFDNRNGNYDIYASYKDYAPVLDADKVLYTNDTARYNAYGIVRFIQRYWDYPSIGNFQEHVHYQNVLFQFTSSMAQSAMNRYKASSTYTNDVAARATSRQASAVTDHINNMAASIFAKNKYNNLIELTVRIDDPIVKPMQLKMGQKVEVIHDGTSYSTILTGREIEGGKVKLIFGTVRLELTKYLKGRY